MENRPQTPGNLGNVGSKPHHIARITDVKQAEQLPSKTRIVIDDYLYSPRRRRYEGTVAGSKIITLLERYKAEYIEWLNAILSYKNEFLSIPKHADDEFTPFWFNGWIPGLDAMLLYTLIRKNNPRTYIEVGSGNSTKFVNRAIQDGNLRTKIISIDPQPRTEIDILCDEIIRAPLEDVDQEIFNILNRDDILFIDNSHRVFSNSDTTVALTEIIPALKDGVLYGLHDIYLPYDYPEEWLDRFYSEQYLFGMYLLGGCDGDHLVFPGIYVSLSQAYAEAIGEIFGGAPALNGVERHAGAFWMRRQADGNCGLLTLRHAREEFVAGLYRAVFNREPDERGFQVYIAALEQRVPPHALVEIFLNSPEFEAIVRKRAFPP
jgi:hypothetical protein